MLDPSGVTDIDWTTRINAIGEPLIIDEQALKIEVKALRGQIKTAIIQRDELFADPHKGPALKRLLERQGKILAEIEKREEEASRRRAQMRVRLFGPNKSKLLSSIKPEGMIRLKAELYAVEKQIAQKLPSNLSTKIQRVIEIEQRLAHHNPSMPQHDLDILQTRTNMAQRHIDTIRNFTAANNTVIIYRGVNPGATPLLETGAYRGKDVFFKGKSSNFKAILAELPLDASLSKLAGLPDPIERADKIKKFQKKIDTALKDYDASFKEIFGIDRGQPFPKVSQAVIDKANMELLAVAEGKKDAKGRQIYIAKDKDGHNLETNGEPVFFVQEGTRYLAYNTNSERYDQPLTLPSHYKVTEVRVPKYCSYALDADGNVIETRHPITADYDALVMATARDFPFSASHGWAMPGMSLAEFQALETEYHTLSQSEPNSPRLDEIEERVLAVLQGPEIQRFRADHKARDYRQLAEEEKSARHEILKYDKFLGIVTDLESAVQGFLRQETEGATSHGAEVRNPFPEPFGFETYTVYLPTGRVKVINSPQDVCDYINALRVEGYAMPVNPRWGWTMNFADGKLYIPEHRLDWVEVEDSIAKLAEQIKTLEHDIKHPSAGQDVEEMVEKLNELNDMRRDQLEMLDLKLEITRLETDTLLTYTQKTPASPLAKRTMALLQQAELADRSQLIEAKTTRLETMMDTYSNRYDDPAPIKAQEDALKHLLASHSQASRKVDDDSQHQSSMSLSKGSGK